MLEILLLILFLVLVLRMTRLRSEVEELRRRLATLESIATFERTASRASTAGRQAQAGDATGEPAFARESLDARHGGMAHPVTREAAEARFDAATPLAAEAVSAASVGAPIPPLPDAALDAHAGRAVAAGAHRTSDTTFDEAPPDLESRIGGRWLLYTGILALLLGVSFFLKYAFDNRWLTETARVVLGGIAGLGLVAGGSHLAARELRFFGQSLIGGGLAILYLSIYAALGFYGLIGRGAAFTLMVLVTATAAWLADRQRSQPLAFIAVGGAFLTPFLVGGDRNAQMTLFSYVALLAAGTLVLARRHGWPGLNALSYSFTLITVVAWAARFYTDAQWLRTLLFLTLFCVIFVQILRETRRVPGVVARAVVWLLATAPVFFHVAAVVLASGHPPAIHIYLIAFTMVGLLVTAEPHRPVLRLLVLLAALLPLFGSLALPTGISWLSANIVTIVAVALLHTVAILDRILRQNEALSRTELVTLHVTGLGLFGLLYEALQRAYPDFRGGLAALLALGAAGLWWLLRTRDRLAALNAAALAATLLAVGIGVQFDGPAAIIGWAAEGAALTWLGLRAPSLAFRAGGLALVGLAIARLLDQYQTPAGFVAVLNARSLTTLFIVSLVYALASLFHRYRDQALDGGGTRAVLHGAASLLTVLWITAEIRSYWEVRYQMTQAYLYEQLMLSLAWGLYGATLIGVGLWRRYALVRYLGIVMLAITILKVFFHDLWELGGIYRIVGLTAFGLLLVMVSYLYQKRRQSALADHASPAYANRSEL